MEQEDKDEANARKRNVLDATNVMFAKWRTVRKR